MKDCRFSKTYFDHLTFYYEPHGFVFPLAAIVDDCGIVICFGFWGLNWTWKKWSE